MKLGLIITIIICLSGCGTRENFQCKGILKPISQSQTENGFTRTIFSSKETCLKQLILQTGDRQIVFEPEPNFVSKEIYLDGEVLSNQNLTLPKKVHEVRLAYLYFENTGIPTRIFFQIDEL